MTHIVAFAVDKGGVGKTTSALNTAARLAMLGHRVLLIDTDQQANLTSVFLRTIPEKTLYDSMMDETESPAIVKIKDNLDLLPAAHKMFGIGNSLVSRMVRNADSGKKVLDCRGILNRILAPISDRYDYIIIDCPPSDNIMMMNALYAAKNVIITAKPEPFGIAGVQNFVKMMRTMKTDTNSALRLAGILITDYETGSVGHHKGEAALRQWAPDFVCETRIRHSRPLANAVLAHQDIYSYYPESNGAKDYIDFTNEFIKRIK